MITYQCIISGKVQGVYYRYSVKKMALSAGFNGYVKNLPNGDVEACVTVTKEKELQPFLDILKMGSPHSKVQEIKTRQIESQYSGFKIKK